MEVLIWLVPIAVLVAGARSPRGGLIVLVGCLPLFGSPPGGPYLAALDVAALLAVATAWRGGPAPASRLDWPVVALLGVSAASLVPLAYHPPSWHPRVLARLLTSLPGVEPWTPEYSWRALASLLVGVGLFVAVRRAFAGRSIRPLFLALAAGLAAAVLLGLAAHAGLLELETYRVKGGATWESRLHSLFFHSGWFAEYLVLAAPLAIGALASVGRRGRAGATLLAVLIVPTTLLTEQRGAWFAVAVQLALAAFLWGRKLLGSRGQWRTLLSGVALAGVLLGVALVARPGMFESVADRAEKAFTLANRTFIWDVATEMTTERPLLGWGIGNFSPVYLEKIGPSAAGPFDWLTAHSQYLMLSAERGLVGLASFVLLIAALVSGIGWSRRKGAGDRTLERCLLVSLAGFLVYGLVQYMFFLRSLEWLFWILAGTVAPLAPRARTATLDRLAQATLLIALALVPWRWLAVEPLRTPGDRAFGLHRAEESGGRSFQWSRGYAAWRHPRRTPLALELANGHPRPDLHRLRVVVRVDGRIALEAEVPGEWRSYPIDLGAAGAGTALIELVAHPTFRPFSDYRGYPDLEPSIDVRLLGAAISPPPTGAPRQIVPADESAAP